MFRRLKLLFGIAILPILLPSQASSQSPVFVTQAPFSGNSAGSFFVFLPVANMGGGDASNMQLTSVTLNFLGQSAAALEQPAALPFVTGSGFLSSGGVRTLDLEFDNSKLVAGNRYLLTVRGTYQSNGTTSGFALNHPVVYSAGLSGTHQQILDIILAKLNSLSLADPRAESQALLTFMSGIPQISSAVIGHNTPNIEATFSDDGEKFIVLNNVRPPSTPVLQNQVLPLAPVRADTAPSRGATPLGTAPLPPVPTFDFPMSSQARLLNGMGSGWSNPIPNLSAWLSANGYEPLAGTEASVSALRSVGIGGDGIFYLNSHGGGDDNETAILWSTTPSDSPPDDLLQSDIKKHLVERAGTIKGHWDPSIREWVPESHWGITPDFIAIHWGDFSQHSFIYIDTCDSDPVEEHAIRDAIFVKHASLYAGWSSTVGDISADTARLVFDRLLGADQFCPENGAPCMLGSAIFPVFAQRPFDYLQVAQDLKFHALGADTNPVSMLNFERNEGSFALLAPSISNMTVDETQGSAGQLTIHGIFGEDPRKVPGGSPDDGVVTVGDSKVQIVKWTSDPIIVNLTSSGPGSSGDVQVVVRQHKSNVARLTEWHGTFQGVWAGNDSLKQTINFQPAFRLDLRQYRPVIHNPPVEPVSVSFQAISSPVSTGSFACTGEGIYTIPGEIDTFTWMGSGNLPLLQAGSTSPPPVFFVADGFLMSHTAMSFGAAAGSTTLPCSFTEHIKFLPPNCDPSLQSCEGDTSGQFPLICSALPATTLTLDPNTAAIQGNIMDLGKFPCFTDQPGRATASWNTIQPLSNTAPDPLSTR
jgi:hypothetical protein